MIDNMEWFNVFGLIFIAVIMIPNVVFAIKCKDGFDNKWNNKYVEITEQVGRLGCFGFMIINIPGTWFGWWSDEAFALYLIVDTILVMLYCAIWIICFKKNSVFRALALSIIPSMLFLFSGIMSRSVLLIIASVLFAPSHIVISYKNVKPFTINHLFLTRICIDLIRNFSRCIPINITVPIALISCTWGSTTHNVSNIPQLTLFPRKIKRAKETPWLSC